MAATETALNHLPGDRRDSVASMLRVDHAGEFGASRIYAGQLAVLGNRHPAAAEIARMQQQEQRHLDWFDAELVKRRVRPTALQPFWNVAGFALGAATALIGPRAAMACTVAVEETIEEHYAHQAAALGDDEKDLRATVEKFRDEEIEHRDTALAAGAEQTPGYEALSAVIKTGSRLAIWLSTRI